MKSANKYIGNVLAVGFVTLTILSTLLFWARKTCQAIFYESVSAGERVEIQPSGLLPELDSDPNVVFQSSIEAYIGDDVASQSLGID